MKTVSLELSKQLKEAGYPQEGQFYWFNKGGEFVFLTHDKVSKIGGLLSNYIASPTADEILEQLPETIQRGTHTFHIYLKIKEKYWYIKYWEWKTLKQAQIGEGIDITLADAAAKMWLYLKKEGLL